MAPDPVPTNPQSPTPMPTPPSSPGDTGTRSTDRIVVYRHSNMFYWWPVWALGFLFALITAIDNQRLAVVPAETKAFDDREIELDEPGKKETRSVLVLPEKKTHHKFKNAAGEDEIDQPRIIVSRFRALGSIYVVVLLIVIIITTITIRGLWTVLVFVSVIMLVVILAAGGWLENILRTVNQLSIFINMGGYLLISLVLCILWLINFFILDRQTYMIFAPGQVRVRVEIGGEETVFDTTGMVVQKERQDMFRHWILGFGSGDLIIKPVGVANPIDFPNVMRVGAIVKKVETMTKEKVIMKAPDSKPANA